jgi:hypothetical protein
MAVGLRKRGAVEAVQRLNGGMRIVVNLGGQLLQPCIVLAAGASGQQQA